MHLLARCRRLSMLPCLALLASCALVLLPACASPAPPVRAGVDAGSEVVATESETGERVSLGFRWPDGFAARVTGAESSRAASDAVEDETRTEMSYRLRAEPTPNGARIRYDDFALPAATNDSLIQLGRVPGLERLSAALQPSFLVSPEGRFAGAPDLDDAVERINQELDALHAQPQGLPEGAPELPTRFSGALFLRHAPVTWWPMVELWAGREIELGRRYQVALVARMPLLDGAPIKMEGELQVSQRVPCDAAAATRDATPRCIELLLVSRPDPLALLPLLGGEAERGSVDGATSPVTITRLELDETVRLVTEPETLVPHHVETTRRARVRLRLSDGSLHTDALDQALDLVFHPES
jgi:hypothetical protein